MTLIKSLMLGTAAGLVAVVSAQAADLPTRKGAVAVEYVKVCSITVGGTPIVGFVLPGSDTCIKFSGYVTGQIEAGNIKNGYTTNRIAKTLPGYTGLQTLTNFPTNRDDYGYSTRFNFTVDAVSNTAYGPLAAHAELQFNHSEGINSLGQGGSDGGLNRAYVTWAGITAGKANSFYSFTGGGYGYANYFSSDRVGYNQPDLMAYTASFGGGFSATISIEDGSGGPNAPGGLWTGSGTGPYFDSVGTNTYLGARYPDIVGALDFSQAWGRLHVGGVAHQDRIQDTASGVFRPSGQNWGFAGTGGIQVNLPTFGAGDKFDLFGSYSYRAQMYGGVYDGMWGTTCGINCNGQYLALSDGYYNGVTWQAPTVGSITADIQHHFTPEFAAALEGSYGFVSWDKSNANSMVSNGTAYLVGGVLNYDPVKNLDFQFELLYESTKSNTPPAYLPGAFPATAGFVNKSDGFQGRFFITRSF